MEDPVYKAMLGKTKSVKWGTVKLLICSQYKLINKYVWSSNYSWQKLRFWSISESKYILKKQCGKEINRQNLGFLGQEKFSAWYNKDGHMSFYICPNT